MSWFGKCEYGSVDLRRDIEGRGEWSGRLGRSLRYPVSDGKHAYVAAYFDDAVSWYERNASTGALTYGGMLKDGVDGVDGLDGAKS